MGNNSPIIIQNRAIRRAQHRKAARKLWKITQGKAPMKEDLMAKKKQIKEAWQND